MTDKRIELDARQQEQERVWDILHARLNQTMKMFGKEDGREPGDFWVFDDNWGSKQHKLMVYNPAMLRPEIVTSLQRVLLEFPSWEIVVAVYIREIGATWPDMGLTVRSHEIVDGLQRQYFPRAWQSIEYVGSRKGRV